MIGRTLGHYRIEAKLGEGGMGVVYRALDTHLDRPVALKILPPEAVAHPERRRRFVQEAKAASALNHPNIITIYDIDSADGVDFIAMEYVAGRTLGETIGRRPLRWSETVRYATQIAGALAAAHAAGIVHRDLKPANIMVGDGGLVKVLDFGLAKLTDPGESDDLAPTIDQGLTREGVILGTVAYMSPEQAEGHKLDARSDIFSFGSVLYEMATGRRAFGGESRASILASILREDPRPAVEVTPGTPPDLARLIEWCLRKDPAERLHSMADAKLLLEQVRETAVAAPARRALSKGLFAAVLALAVVAAAGTWMLARRGGAPESAPMTLTRLTFDSGLTTDPAISPDGKLVAYASDRSSEGSLDIWVQQAAGGSPIQLTRDPSDDSEPAFSPDGSQIAFRSERDGGGVYVVPALGGEARRIARQGRRPRYSPDGKWIAYWTGEFQLVPAQLYVVAASGGETRQLAADFFSARYPVWSPDSKRILFLGTQNRENPDYRWWIVAAQGGSPTAASAPRSAIPEAWLGEPDRAVFSAGQGDIRNLWETSLAADAVPSRLTFGPGVHTGASVAGGSTVVFADLNENLDIWSLPIDADRAKVTGELRRLTLEPSREGRPSVSSDGRRVAFNTFRSGNADAWVKDLATGRDTGVGVTPAPETGPIVNADGTRVAWSTNDDSIWVAPAAGGDAERVCQGCRLPTGWSHDGKWIAYELTANRSAPVVELAGGRKVDILKHAKFGVSRVRFSPDDRWLSFHTISGPATRQILVVPYKGPVLHEEKDWIPITDGKAIDRYADWSPDGNMLYFLSEREGFRCLWAQRLDPASKQPQGAAFPVYHFHHARRSLMAMGDPVNVQPTVGRDKIVFAMAETTGNIWLAKPVTR